MFWVFHREACGILALQPGTGLPPPSLEGKVLTIGPPEKSLTFYTKPTLSIYRNTHTLTFTQAHRHTFPVILPTLVFHSLYHILSHAIVYSFCKCLSPYATLPACPEWNVNSMRAGVLSALLMAAFPESRTMSGPKWDLHG